MQAQHSPLLALFVDTAGGRSHDCDLFLPCISLLAASAQSISYRFLGASVQPSTCLSKPLPIFCVKNTSDKQHRWREFSSARKTITTCPASLMYLTPAGLHCRRLHRCTWTDCDLQSPSRCHMCITPFMRRRRLVGLGAELLEMLHWLEPTPWAEVLPQSAHPPCHSPSSCPACAPTSRLSAKDRRPVHLNVS